MDTQTTLPTKKYLGDGVYMSSDGYHIILTAENGISVTNIIYLDPEVLQNFKKALISKDDIPM